MPFERPFHTASRAEWQKRYEQWLRDPVRTQMYQARPLFDLRPVHGRTSLWQDVERTVAGATDRDFLRVLANDCLASLPPLTFFQDAVVGESGEQTTTFRLEHSALRPLVDVGRVFGMAANRVLGTSTLERFALARSLLPEHESIFREAAETLRILLWQQARIGIAQGTRNASSLSSARWSSGSHHIKRHLDTLQCLLQRIEPLGQEATDKLIDMVIEELSSWMKLRFIGLAENIIPFARGLVVDGIEVVNRRLK